MEDHETHATHETQYEQTNEATQGTEPEPESFDGGSGADPDGNTPHNTNTGIAGPDAEEAVAPSTQGAPDVQGSPNDTEGCL